MKNILVTGGGGYIGSHVVKKLLQAGIKVTVLDNFSNGYREPMQILSKYGELSVYEGDTRKKEFLEELFEKEKIDIVIHLAAVCSVDESVKDPDLYFENNVQGTENLLSAMYKAGVSKIIFSSTCAVYGKAEALPVSENHPLLPQNPYGESKLKSEQLIEEYGRDKNFNYIIFRYFNVSGADTDGEIGDSKKPSELLIQNAVRGALGIEPFFATYGEVKTEDGSPVRDYIDIEDIVQAHIKAMYKLEKEDVKSVINLGSGKGWSVKEIIRVVENELGLKISLEKSKKQREGEVEEIYADINKAKATLGWQPQSNLKNIVQSLACWYRNKPNGYIK